VVAPPAMNDGVLEDVGQELLVVGDAEQDGVAEGADEAAAGLVAVRPRAITLAIIGS
jgi:hypothetical protein